MPELVQGGFIFGAAGGRGALMARNGARDWSPPAFYGMGSGSVGFQIGAKVSEVVFIIRTDKGLSAILDHKFKFGAEGGVTLVAVGIGLEGASTTAMGADIVAFGSSAGLFAGVSLEGSYLDADNDWNALYYGPGATTKAIVLDRRFTAMGADIVAFGNSAGLFAGVSLEGSYLDADNDWNALYYGPGATTKAIVLDRRFSNPGAEPIRQYMAKW